MIERRIEHFRHEAAKARLRAAGSPEHREAFLSIAADWESLAREALHLARALQTEEPAHP